MYFSKNLTRRRTLAKRAGELLVRRYASFAVLLMMLLFAGCEEGQEPEIVNTNFIPVGEWADDYGSYYTITNTRVVYDDGYGYGNFTGSIITANDFSSDSGVLIIEIISSNVGYTVNKFTGVYYKEYTASHVYLANPADKRTYAPIEKDTFAEAQTTFTVDNVDTHVTYWGTGYNK
jgi:hypothetical protein